jgi:hypothetical protein
VTRLRKDQAEELISALDSATSGPLEEITMIRARLTTALRIVLELPTAGWNELVHAAADIDDWDIERRAQLLSADAPHLASDSEAVLWALWDLVTELNERRCLS